MVSRRQVVLGAFWVTAERSATQGISFIVIVLLARLLGPRDFGLVTLAATIILLAQALIGETFDQALIQRDKIEPGHIWSTFWLLLGCGLFGTLFFLIVADWLAALFGQPGLAPILRGVSPLPLLTAIQAVPASLFKRELNFRTLAMASTAGTLLGGFAGVVLAFRGFGPWSLVTNLLVQNAVLAATIWHKSGLRVQFVWSKRHLSELWSFARYSFLLRIAAFTANQSPRILVGYLFGVTALGVFSLGLRIVEIMYQLLALPAANVAMPMIARMRHDTARLESAILSTIQLSAAVSVPAFLGVALVSPLLVPLLFGPQWVGGVVIVQLLALSGMIGGIGLVSLNIISGFGRPNINLAITSGAAVISVAVLLLTSPWGVVVATTAFIVRGFLWAPMLFFLIARITGIRASAFFQICLPIGFAALLMAAAVEAMVQLNFLSLSPPLLTLVATSTGILSYLVGLYIFAQPVLRLGSSVFNDLVGRRSRA